MDIQHLVDRLEDLIDEGRHFFGTKYTMIDEERALEIIDQMRISIPEEIEKAARVLQQRDRVLAEANEEAARIIQQARQQSEGMVDQHQMVQQAKVRSGHVVEQAKIEAQKITNEADGYVLRQLQQLENQIAHSLGEVRNGIDVMQQESPPAPKPMEQPLHMPRPVERETVDVDSPSQANTQTH